MNVLHVSNNFTPYSGGVVRALQALLPAQIKQGINVTLATLEFSPPPTDPDPSWVIRVPCPIKFHYKNNPMAVPFHVQAFFEELFVSLKHDIIHTHHPFLLGSAALKLSHRYGIPIIF